MSSALIHVASRIATKFDITSIWGQTPWRGKPQASVDPWPSSVHARRSSSLTPPNLTLNERQPSSTYDEPTARGEWSAVGCTTLVCSRISSKCEKQYQTALVNVLGLLYASVAALAAYGAALSPTNSRAAVGVSQAPSDADDALRAYADSIDDWRENLKLGEIRKLDAEIEVASRDREILITVLTKVSKQKQTFKYGNNIVIRDKACHCVVRIAEAHLATKQPELEDDS